MFLKVCTGLNRSDNRVGGAIACCAVIVLHGDGDNAGDNASLPFNKANGTVHRPACLDPLIDQKNPGSSGKGRCAHFHVLRPA